MDNFDLTVPHPANFALHKLIIFQRRANKEKALKDRNTAIEVLKALILKGESDVLRQSFRAVPSKWQKKIVSGLDELTDREIIDILK